MAGDTKQNIMTVSDLNRKIKSILETGIGKVKVTGEISNWKLATSGHCYFALKDEKSIIRCVMFRGDLSKVRFKPADGVKVEAEGECTVYEARGEYQIIINKLSEAGIGDLYRKFLELKDKLQSEGLFDPAVKKPLPYLPGRIGIVTSPTGAAIRDILNILNRRFANVKVILYPVKVQGEGAAQEIAQGIRRLNELNLADVMIVGRGGGSIEDLWAFNEEPVARAIYASKIPVISAVGHEIDFTIADFVADLRAPTPSAAAELVVKNRKDLLATVNDYDKRLSYLLKNRVDMARSRVSALANSWGFRKPADLLRQFQQRLDDSDISMERSIKLKLERRTNKVVSLVSKLDALNPEAVLQRGYSIVFKGKQDKVIKNPDQVKSGDNLRIHNAGGNFHAIVVDDMPLFDGLE